MMRIRSSASGDVDAVSPSPAALEDRVRGIVERCDRERNFGYVLRRNALGIGFGRKIFFNIDSLRGGRLPLPGTYVTFVLTVRPDGRDGRWLADDVAVESREPEEAS